METTKLNSDIFYSRPIYSNNHSNTYLKDDVFYKLFKDTHKKEIDEKVKKIKLANERGINDQLVLNQVEIDGSIIGYSYITPNFDELKQLDSFAGTKQKIKELEGLKNKLNILHENGIIHGDIRLRNLYVDKNNNIIFRDLDNIRIDNLSFNDNSRIQDMYIRRFGEDEIIDNLSFNIATISHINHVIEAYAIDYVIEKGLPKIIRNAENEQIMNAMITLNSNKEIKPFTLNKKRR